MIGQQRTLMPWVAWGTTAGAASLAAALGTIALVLARAGKTGDGFIGAAILPAGLGVIAVAAWLLVLALRENDTSLRAITATLGFVVTGAFVLACLGALAADGGGVREFYRPSTTAGSAGLWLMIAAALPFSAAAGLDYRRSDSWYSSPMTAVLLTWLAMAAITVLDVLVRLDG